MEIDHDATEGHTINGGPSSVELTHIESDFKEELKASLFNGANRSETKSNDELYWITFNHRILADDEVVALSIRKDQGDLEARNELVLSNLRLVPFIARRYGYLNRGLPDMDVYQEGIIGLMKGVDKFDHTKGYKLATYAIWWIRQSISRAIANQSSEIRLPVHHRDKFRKIKKCSGELLQTLGRRPTLLEISKATGFDVYQIDSIMNGHGQVVCSIHDTVGHDDGETELGALIPDTQSPDPLQVLIREESLQSFDEQTVRLQTVLRQLRTVSERDKEIFSYFYSLNSESVKIPKSLAITGARFNVTRERTRQILEYVWSRIVKRDQSLQRIRVALSIHLKTNVGNTRDFVVSPKNKKQVLNRPVKCLRASPAFVRWNGINSAGDRLTACFMFVAYAYELKITGHEFFGTKDEVDWAKSVAVHIASEVLGVGVGECAKKLGIALSEVIGASQYLAQMMLDNQSVRNDVERMLTHFRGLLVS